MTLFPRVLAVSFLLLYAVVPVGVTQPSDTARQALIVLLDAEMRGAPSAEEVVREVNGGRPAPGDLPVGSPRQAAFGLTHRAQGVVKTWLRNHPDEVLARLHRYVVLEYPRQANLDAILQALSHNPHVLHVERDRLVQLSSASAPNDPFLQPAPVSTDYQWGHAALDIPAAWSLTPGHGYVGLADSGVQVEHPDLRAFHEEPEGSGNWIYDGGNLRSHLAWDFGDDDANVDELEAGPNGTVPDGVGHGTHVAGLVAATADNGLGGAGGCQHCSLTVAKVTGERFREASSQDREGVFYSDVADALFWLTSSGIQVVTLSLGARDVDCSSPRDSFSVLCSSLQLLDQRDQLVVAASGNDRLNIEFPASEPQVLAVGGIEYSLAFWDDYPECPYLGFGFGELQCGSNYQVSLDRAGQDLVAPAKTVLSTFYVGGVWNEQISCLDSNYPESGYAFCTGTSMAAPHVAGIAGMLRSINPLLPRNAIHEALITNASSWPIRDAKLGYGVPSAFGSALAVLGGAGADFLPNRLTPLFSFYSQAASTHFYTSVPQMGTAAIFDCQAPFGSEGSGVSWLKSFPGASEGPCEFFSCGEVPPRAAVYIFTMPREPFSGAPSLVPLYRMSYDPDRETRCREGVLQPATIRRGYFYTTDIQLLPSAKSVGYELDGREGYIFQRCEPEPDCIPDGAVRLYRLYNPAKDDYVLFPESELFYWQSAGYTSLDGLNDWIGYVYPNVDSDLDGVIDGFEKLVGTDESLADSDCDGVPDGNEILGDSFYLLYSNPLDQTCMNLVPIFSDNFEAGNLNAWSSVVQ